MSEIDVQTEMACNPMYLDPKRPETWGEEVSTAGSSSCEELPIRITILVRSNEFVGLRGPARVLEAIHEDMCCYGD
jgi:hypothetical protein